MIAAFDVGGTTVKYTVGTSEGEFKIRPEEARTQENVAEQVGKKALELSKRYNIEKVAISTAGTPDLENKSTSRIQLEDGTTVENVQYGEKILERLGDVDIAVENDVNTAALGEYCFGDDSDCDDLVYVTFSTGIGAGMVLGGDMVRGRDGNAGKVGHYPLAPGLEELTERTEGSWEEVSGGKGISDFLNRFLSERTSESELGDLQDPDAEEIYSMAQQGNELAEEFVTEHVGSLHSRGIATLALTVDPEVIKVGGSIAVNNPDYILDPIKEGLDRYYPDSYSRPEISITGLGGHTELYGCLALPEYRGI